MNLSYIEYTSIQRFIKMLYNFDNFFFTYSFSVVILNIFIYLTSSIVLFLIFFFFNLDSFINLNDWKTFSSINYIYMSVILILLSMLGMPPMAGFCGKFIMAIFLSLNSLNFFFFLFIILNLFMIYFYLQNFRFLIKKSSKFNLLNYSSYNFLILIFLIFFLTFFSFFFNDIFLIISSLLYF